MAGLTPLANKRRRRANLSAWAMSVDLVCISLAFVIASLFRAGEIDLDQVGRILLCTLPIYLGIALNNQSHHVKILLNGFKSAWRAGTAFAFSAAAMLLIAFFMKIGEDFSRLLFGFGTVFALILLTVWRNLLVRIGRRYLGESPFANLCIYDQVPRNTLSGEGSIDASAFGLSSPYPSDPVAVSNLAHVAQGMDRVIVHCQPAHRMQWASMLRSLDVPSEIVTPELTDLHPLGISHRSGQASLLLSGGPMPWTHRALKRAFDLAVTLPVMPILLPFLGIVALMVKLDSPGPAFFRQERIGLGNRKFHILKFRTMRVEATDANGDRSAARDDDRITRLGRILRQTSIDELPQFLNVLTGCMSIVGPRPHAMGSRAEDALFWDIDDRYWHRHSVKPGLTGLAQIRGYRGATEMKLDLTNRLQSDLEYIAEWSLLTDVRIILQTFSVLFHKNAF
ncbi:sugar transferase [Sphingopyxis indica]|uniref:sugar transferase n=1 Tax=Sphingopyxis indica TaxID=436663 RepID=UPI00293931FF|nr:sugar transferase [Sphingopyxis indica]